MFYSASRYSEAATSGGRITVGGNADHADTVVVGGNVPTNSGIINNISTPGMLCHDFTDVFRVSKTGVFPLGKISGIDSGKDKQEYFLGLITSFQPTSYDLPLERT